MGSFPTELEPGVKLDQYELLCPIAQGGMAQVWLARLHGVPENENNEKLVAIKTILTQYATDLRFQQMFLEEARIASGIAHPNVAKIYDVGEQGDWLFLVMEWVDGESLNKLFRAREGEGKHMPPGIVGRILADACAGLHAAHELTEKATKKPLGVVHRDVSPQNILVSVKGNVKLIDFGLAAKNRASDTAGGGEGKILYMAPEQALGEAVDRRADIWAVGAVLYHMLTGVPAFEGESRLATLRMLTQKTLAIPKLPDDVPAPLRSIIAKTLVRDPEKRIGSAEELGRAIEDAMARARITTTSSDVATFFAAQLRDRNRARTEAVAIARKAATQREIVRNDLPRSGPLDEESLADTLAVKPKFFTTESVVFIVAGAIALILLVVLGITSLSSSAPAPKEHVVDSALLNR